MAPLSLTVRDATKRDDGHDILDFRCWSGDPDEPYAEEAEDYIRRFALRSTFKTLTFRGPNEALVAVSAFDKRVVAPFEAARYVVPGWHLQVMGVARPFQGATVASDLPGCPPKMRVSEYVLRRTYGRMLEIDSTRVIVFARIHDDNTRSMAACERVQLERTVRESPTYWRMLGEVDPTVGCSN